MSEVTHSGLPTAARRFQPRGEGGYLRREPRQLLPRRDGLRGQLRAHVGEGGIEHVARQHGAQQQIRIRCPRPAHDGRLDKNGAALAKVAGVLAPQRQRAEVPRWGCPGAQPAPRRRSPCRRRRSCSSGSRRPRRPAGRYTSSPARRFQRRCRPRAPRSSRPEPVMPTPRTGKEPYLSCRACSPLRTTPSCWRWMMSVLANTAQRLCQLALMRGEPAAAQRAVLEQRRLAGRKRKSRNLGFLRIFGDFLCTQKVTRRRHGHADSPTNSPPKTHYSQPFTI